MDMDPRPTDPRNPDYQWRRFGTEQESRDALPEPSLDDPVSVALLFVRGLGDPVEYRDALDFLVTPESRPAWGDFTAAAGRYAAIQDPGFGSMINLAEGAEDVGYFKILSNVTTSYEVLDDQLIAFAAVITLVWRPEFDRWMVHSIGDYVKPEDLPRTARG